MAIVSNYLKLSLMAWSFILAGCAANPTFVAYSEHRLSTDKESRVHGVLEGNHVLLQGLNVKVLITCVDGKSTDAFVSKYRDRFPTDIALLPGRHYIGVIYTSFGSYALAHLTLNANAGRDYQIKYSSDAKQAKLWIEDLNNHEVVGDSLKNSPESIDGINTCSSSLDKNYQKTLVVPI